MMFGVHPDLRRYVSVAFYLSAAVGVTGVLFLILGITQNSAGTPHWPFIIFGIVAILSGYLGVTMVPRHYRSDTHVVASVMPTPQRIILELESDSDSTSLYATPVDAEGTRHRKRLALLIPIWSVEPLLGNPLEASAYVDPATNEPVAFRTPKGLLWCLLPWQSVA